MEQAYYTTEADVGGLVLLAALIIFPLLVFQKIVRERVGLPLYLSMVMLFGTAFVVFIYAWKNQTTPPPRTLALLLTSSEIYCDGWEQPVAWRSISALHRDVSSRQHRVYLRLTLNDQFDPALRKKLAPYGSAGCRISGLDPGDSDIPFEVLSRWITARIAAPSYPEALARLHTAVEQGDVEATYTVAIAYDLVDPANSLPWYRMAAERGHPAAQFELGSWYSAGAGVPQDDLEAAKWYGMAAERGHASAQSTLADRYAKGEGVPQDYVQAYKWYELAAANYPADDLSLRDMAATLSRAVAAKMTPDQLADAQRLVREWKPTKP